MPVRIVIVRQGNIRILQEWLEEETDPSLTEAEWEAGARLWPEGLIHGFHTQPEVFLCPDQEDAGEDYETDVLGKVIEKAQASLWGMKLYVVVDRSVYADLEQQRRLNSFRKDWFNMLLEKGVCDVLELKASQVETALLREAAIRARGRLEMRNRQALSGRWKCLLYEEPSPYTSLFLEDFLLDALPQDASNCLIVLRDCADTRIEFVRQAFNERPPGKVLIGLWDALADPHEPGSSQTTDPLMPQEGRLVFNESKQLRKLKQLCEEYESRLLIFHDLFELYYFLLGLHQDYDQYKEILQYAGFVAVRQTFFQRHAPQLLITHSFYPSDPNGSLVAAGDAYMLRRALGSKFEVLIHPAMQSIGFRNTLKGLTQLLVWVHIGHGDGENGLQQADGHYKSAEEWISCFAGYGRSLSLAVFSSCSSSGIAEKFAKAGVGVTIGFKKDVRKDLCGEMAVALVEAAFNSSGDRDRIVNIFQAVKNLIPDAEPVIFCARH